MSNNSKDYEFIFSIIGTVCGGLLSAYLAKKMIDALDTGKKVPSHSVMCYKQDADAAKKMYAEWQKKFEARTGKPLEIDNNVIAIYNMLKFYKIV